MWTQEQRNVFGELLVVTCKIYGFDMGRDVARLTIEDLQDLDALQCLAALTSYRKNPKNKTWPRAADIRALVQPDVDENAVAVELAHKIDHLIARMGYNWEQGVYVGAEENVFLNTRNEVFATFKEAVISEVGEIGWKVIQSRGGWLNLRNSSNEMEEGTFKAQFRDHVKSVISRSRAGYEISDLALPSSPSEGIKILETSKIKLLE